MFREAPAIARAAVTYFAVRIRVNAVTAVLLLVLMLVVGVDDALLWAVGAFFLSFVPVPRAVAGADPADDPRARRVRAAARRRRSSSAASSLNLVAENVLEPTLTGRALSLSTWLVFIMFFFWVWLIGPVGALLSMPITVLIVLVLQHNEPTRWVAALLTREGRAGGGSAADPRGRPPMRRRPSRRRGSRLTSMSAPVVDPRFHAPPRRVIALLVFAAAVFWFARPVMLPFVVGAIIAYAFSPVHRPRPGADRPVAAPDRGGAVRRPACSSWSLVVIAFAGPVSREVALLIRSGPGRARRPRCASSSAGTASRSATGR